MIITELDNRCLCSRKAARMKPAFTLAEHGSIRRAFLALTFLSQGAGHPNDEFECFLSTSFLASSKASMS